MTTAIPLFPHHAADQLVYQDQTRRVTRDTFAAMARAVAVQLPAQHAILNLCEDRLFFMLGFCAALLRDCPTLLPGNRSAAGELELLAAVPQHFLLGDNPPRHAGAPHLRLDQMRFAACADPALITLHEDAVVATLFTSGTTGAPQPHRKNWRMLATGAALLRNALDIRGSVISSVPSQHMFGLESTVLLPMQAGLTVVGDCPLLPKDIQATMERYAASATQPLWWMTTPLHLRACAQSGLRFPALSGGMLCATQTLSPELARAAEACFQTRLHEIYGCTEAGMVALRRPTLDAVWQLCADLEMRQAQQQTWISGLRAGDALPLNDDIEMLPDRRFILRGRHLDLIKIGGKRVHIDALNHALLSLPGVQDGAFFQAEEGGRLAAFVVMENFHRATLLDALRQRFDPVFLPRPLHHVVALPRNDVGKLPRAALQMLMQQLSQ